MKSMLKYNIFLKGGMLNYDKTEKALEIEELDRALAKANLEWYTINEMDTDKDYKVYKVDICPMDYYDYTMNKAKFKERLMISKFSELLDKSEIPLSTIIFALQKLVDYNDLLIVEQVDDNKISILGNLLSPKLTVQLDCKKSKFRPLADTSINEALDNLFKVRNMANCSPLSDEEMKELEELESKDNLTFGELLRYRKLKLELKFSNILKGDDTEEDK